MSDNISILIDTVVQEMGMDEGNIHDINVLNFLGKIGNAVFAAPPFGDAMLILMINLIAYRYRHHDPEELSAFMFKLNKTVRTCIAELEEKDD